MITKLEIKKYLTIIKKYISKLRLKQRFKVLLRSWPHLRRLVNSWQRLFAIILLFFIVLYYPLGALISENIDTDTNFVSNVSAPQSASIDTMSRLIKREVYYNSWTPALPFIFPASLLDNMPAFQSGIMSSISKLSYSFARHLNHGNILEENALKNAAALLQYPQNIWMFSATNKLVPAPSSNSQYRRARKQLQKYNRDLKEGVAVFEITATNLNYFLQAIRNDLLKSSAKLNSHIRENNTSFYDGKADDVFYYQKGKLYSYYLLITALNNDFKDIIVAHNLYPAITSLLKNLEQGALLSPAFVRNGEIDSIFAPNHLVGIGYFTDKAIIKLQNIIKNLNKDSNNGVNK